MAETIKLARLNGWSWKAIISHVGLGHTKINEIMGQNVMPTSQKGSWGNSFTI